MGPFRAHYSVNMRVIVVEDEKTVAEFLSQSISSAGYDVRRFEDLKDFSSYLHHPNSEAPQVFVLDRLIDREDTADLLLQIKARFPESRIMFLSAIATSGEKIRMLKAGADDYLAKPFAIEELLARIEALCRRSSLRTDLIECGNLKLNPSLQQAEVAGRKLDLSKKEYQLLMTLSSQPTRVFSRIQLLQTIWDSPESPESNVVEVTIKNLRKKLEKASANVKISSKRFLGYWIET